MSLTKPQLSLIRKGLISAKKYLWLGEGPVTIIDPRMAMKWAHRKGEISNRSLSLSSQLIEERLGGKDSLRTWLYSQGIPLNDLSHKNVQAHTLAWIDDILEKLGNEQQYSEK